MLFDLLSQLWANGEHTARSHELSASLEPRACNKWEENKSKRNLVRLQISCSFESARPLGRCPCDTRLIKGHWEFGCFGVGSVLTGEKKSLQRKQTERRRTAALTEPETGNTDAPRYNERSSVRKNRTNPRLKRRVPDVSRT